MADAAALVLSKDYNVIDGVVVAAEADVSCMMCNMRMMLWIDLH